MYDYLATLSTAAVIYDRARRSQIAEKFDWRNTNPNLFLTPTRPSTVKVISHRKIGERIGVPTATYPLTFRPLMSSIVDVPHR
jgi:hypothetical protein